VSSTVCGDARGGIKPRWDCLRTRVVRNHHAMRLGVNPQPENAVSQIQSDRRELACVITAASHASEAGAWPRSSASQGAIEPQRRLTIGRPRSEKRGPSSWLSTTRLQGIPRNRELSVSVLVSVWLSAGVRNHFHAFILVRTTM
jgi:hypothetical protein